MGTGGCLQRLPTAVLRAPLRKAPNPPHISLSLFVEGIPLTLGGPFVHSRYAIAKRNGAWAVKAKNGGKFPTTKAKAKAEPEPAKAGRFYSTEDVKKPMASSKSKHRATKIKASCAAGAVLILLAGPHKGKRVVCLGSLPSGLLLVTGPFKLNGCPIRRVNQAYVIGTSTTVDVSKVDTSKFTDAYFAKDPSAKKDKSAEDFGDQEEEPAKEVPAERKADQEAVDSKINPGSDLAMYLSKKFFLTKGQYPHTMKF